MNFTRVEARAVDGSSFDLICFFDFLHDLGDPVGAALHAFAALKSGGTVLLVERTAGDVSALENPAILQQLVQTN